MFFQLENCIIDKQDPSGQDGSRGKLTPKHGNHPTTQVYYFNWRYFEQIKEKESVPVNAFTRVTTSVDVPSLATTSDKPLHGYVSKFSMPDT